MRKVVIAGLLLTVAAAPAAAATIFDSQALGEPLCSDPATYTCVTNRRDSYYNFAAVVHFDADVTISQFGVYTAVGGSQNVQFLIFASAYDAAPGDTEAGDVLFSQTRYVKSRDLGFLYTDPMSFTFQAGKTYDIGIIGSQGSLTGRYVTAVDPGVTSISLTEGPITEYAANANIGYYGFDPSMPATTGFNHPFTGGYTGSAAYIQLNTVAVPVTNDVPEPATWALMIAGFGLVGAAVRRRRVVPA